ncbi:glycoside hydrolase [Flaviaesturariibacter flavus]|uniref:Glycoside hydrolase n=1 Tax=Flaviaesturariibacter flavus TaxID=2502780 RepID=A0A4R1BPM7_9BACT|nr:glycoside hydrolase family 97 protein [Flaviaesturariibacter flavus]TCJ19580.1 glycoside hydrolase [Flaviaesturariibacter flavus]
MKLRTLTVFVVACCLGIAAHAADTITVKSPDGNLRFQLFLRQHQLHFSITRGGQRIVAASPIGLGVNGTDLCRGVHTGAAAFYRGNERYELAGAHAVASNSFTGARVPVVGRGGWSMSLDIRVFNDGAAYRHLVTGKASELIPEENTVFRMAPGSTVWYHDLNMHYESVHVKKKLDEIAAGAWLAPPAVFKTPDGNYAAITEAALLRYPGMALQSDGSGGAVLRLAHEQPTSYPYKLRYSPEDTMRLRQPARLAGNSFQTPWRVVIVGANLNTLVNNDIVSNLNAAPDRKLFPQGAQTPWVRPGRAVWKYLDGGGEGTPEVMRHFTDGAAALGFEHNILEGFWSRWSRAELKDLVDYSRAKGVGIWLWKHSKGLRTRASRDSFFTMCSELGIAGAKIDFFDHEAKEVIDLYEAILTEAAAHHLLLDFHGANKPTGLMRTFPNELTAEAVKGMEASKLTDRATHGTTIPFTRLIAGPAEYTVVHFGARRANTTWAHQVASAAILSSPLLTYAANPDSLLASPAVNIIRAIPPHWDETRVLPPSEIGEIAVFARRKGKEWFLAVMNGTTARHIRIPLSFLKGSYGAEMALDVPGQPAALRLQQKRLSGADTIELDLVSGGGFIARFAR